jgi:hypothetical protein
MNNRPDLEQLLYRIVLQETSFIFNNEKYTLKIPDYTIKSKALEIYFDIINDEKFYGWLREKDLELFLISSGYWSFNTTNNIRELEKRIEKIKISLYKERLNKNAVKGLKSRLSSTIKELDKITHPKFEIYQNTLEGYANSIKNEYIICNCLTKNNKLVFKFNDNTSYVYFNSLISASYENYITPSQIRELAKHNLWRSIWSCNKTDPFGIPGSINLSDDQRVLINLSIMYDSVYEHPECPENFVIDDDDMLDGWMLYQKEQNKKEKAKSEISDVHKNSQEVFIMTNNAEDRERINEMNDNYSKSIITNRFKEISQKGTVSDLDLPDVRADWENEMRQKAKRN